MLGDSLFPVAAALVYILLRGRAEADTGDLCVSFQVKVRAGDFGKLWKLPLEAPCHSQNKSQCPSSGVQALLIGP